MHDLWLTREKYNNNNNNNSNFFCANILENQAQWRDKTRGLINQAITDSFDSSNIFIVGDFNADLIKTSLFSPFLNSFISECHFIPSDIKYLPPDSFTYVSDAHGSRSWLDHVLCTHSSHSSVSDMVTNYDCVSSDHFPLSFTISIKLLPTSESSTTQQTCKPSPMWDCASSHDILNYYNNSGSLLSGIDVPHAASLPITA